MYLSLGERMKAVAARVVTDRQTDRHTHIYKPSTITLAVHAQMVNDSTILTFEMKVTM